MPLIFLRNEPQKDHYAPEVKKDFRAGGHFESEIAPATVMPGIKILNLSKNTTLSENASLADSFLKRLIGLMGKSNLESKGGLIIKPCSSIHTFFMRFPIDAAFVDRENRIVKTYPFFHPWRLSGMFLNSVLCIELPVGTLSITCTQTGDYIQIETI